VVEGFRSGDDARIHRVMFLAEVRVVLRAGVVVRLTRFVATCVAAKPNHGFFHCQQVVAIFFLARRRASGAMRHRDAVHAV